MQRQFQSIIKFHIKSNKSRRRYSQAAATAASPARIPPPPTAPKPDAKIQDIVDTISTLNLLEASHLVSALKVKLNISDIVMAGPSPASAPAASSTQSPDAAPEKPAEQAAFKVTLVKIDASQKAKVIKEIKQMMPGVNLVEAKKFVEGAPKVIKDNVAKEEAEKMKKALEAVGATVSFS